MVFAISDMDIFQELTPSYIDKHADAIRQAHIVLVDANAPIESLERVVQLSKNGTHIKLSFYLIFKILFL